MGRDFSIGTDLAFTLGMAGAALATAGLLLLAIVVLRGWRALVERGRGEREARWDEALRLAADDPSAPMLPRLASLKVADYLEHWNRFRDRLEPAAAENLALMLKRQGMDQKALAMLNARTAQSRLLAIETVGTLRDPQAWDRLVHLSRQPDPVVSFSAARALLRIDARRGLELLATSIAQREDWPLARLGSIFQELGSAIVTAPLVTLLITRPRPGLDRVVKLARFAERSKVGGIVRSWLSATQDPELTMAALNYVEGAEDLGWVIAASGHAEWTVRMAAARALGRIGQREELPALLLLLRDPVWWVRYHAAQAVAGLEGLEPHELARLQEGLRDVFAADMLAQALAEMGRR